MQEGQNFSSRTARLQQKPLHETQKGAYRRRKLGNRTGKEARNKNYCSAGWKAEEMELPPMWENSCNTWSSVLGWIRNQTKVYGSRLEAKPALFGLVVVGIYYRHPNQGENADETLPTTGRSLMCSGPVPHGRLTTAVYLPEGWYRRAQEI